MPRFRHNASIPITDQSRRLDSDNSAIVCAVRASWGGIHFRNSLDAGFYVGTKMAAYMIEHSLHAR
jgi:hypothetical protein